MVSTKLKIFIVILIFLILSSSSPRTVLDLFSEENEAYAYAGLFAAIPETADAFSEVPAEEFAPIEELMPEEEVKEKEAVSDTHEQPYEYVPPIIEKKTPSQVTEEYFILKWTGEFCGPCKIWDANELPKIQRAGIKVEKIYSEKRQEDFRKFKIDTIPAFWICKVSDRKPVLKFGNKNADFLLSEINKLSSARSTPQVSKQNSGTPFYKRQSSGTIWSIPSGDTHPSKEDSIKHLRSEPHPKLHSWPLEKLTKEELWWIHWDDHNGKLGNLQWK